MVHNLSTLQKTVDEWGRHVPIDVRNEVRAMIEDTKDTVGKLNRMIEQHPENNAYLSWVTLKEWIEKELLGYEVTVKS